MGHHRIESVTVEGFWGEHRVKTKVFSDVTFFIGVNGTGKTTLINLIAATLLCDFETLDKISFERIEIVLSPIAGGKKPSITAIKAKSNKSPFPNINYELRQSSSSEPQKFSLDDIQEQLFVRQRNMPMSAAKRDLYRYYGSSILEKMRDLVQVSWLSIHRAQSIARGEDRAYESTVDRKIEQLNNDLVRYFSSLSSLRDKEVKKFQEYIFVSLLEVPDSENSLSITPDTQIDVRGELQQIFKELHLSSPDITKKIDSFIAALHRVSGEATEKGIAIHDFIFLQGLSRINSIVNLWRGLQDRSSEIFSPREKFIELLNSMLRGKKAEIGSSNEIVFRTPTQTLTPFMLSSGEKQLFILFGEVLLQRNQPCVFVADEPELSLHVSWQERLISSLRILNSSSQILAATHSPDIVGSLFGNAIDMETILK